MIKVLAAASVALTLAGPSLAESLPTFDPCPVKVNDDSIQLEDVGVSRTLTFTCRSTPLPRPVDLFEIDPETEESKT